MNSIRRPRRRARKRSVNWCTFAWLLIREAGWRICYDRSEERFRGYTRAMYCSRQTRSIERGVRNVLTLAPQRRFYP